LNTLTSRTTLTGHYYYGGRYYFPSISRFITEDGVQYSKLNNPLTLNRYVYALNNPETINDPSGHWDAKICGGGSGGEGYISPPFSLGQAESWGITLGVVGVGTDTIALGCMIFTAGFVSAPEDPLSVPAMLGGTQIVDVGSAEISAAFDAMPYLVTHGSSSSPQETWSTIQGHFLNEEVQSEPGGGPPWPPFPPEW
jgi:RHS repeat-associated protein